MDRRGLLKGMVLAPFAGIAVPKMVLDRAELEPDVPVEDIGQADWLDIMVPDNSRIHNTHFRGEGRAGVRFMGPGQNMVLTNCQFEFTPRKTSGPSGAVWFPAGTYTLEG